MKLRMEEAFNNHFGKPADGRIGFGPPSMEDAAAAREGRPRRDERERNRQPPPPTSEQMAAPTFATVGSNEDDNIPEVDSRGA